MTNTEDYLLGCKDCEKGIPSKNGMSDEYYRGYGDTYAEEAQLTAKTEDL